MAPTSSPQWSFELQADERESLASDFMTTLIDLNLTLPPDPQAKHVPTTLSDATDDKILLGCMEDADGAAAFTKKVASAKNAAGVVPREVTRVLSQTPECLRWNAALALYILGLDLVAVCSSGLQRSLAKWQRRGEQAKILVTS